jgi:NAD(P)-dependent dehydrogenase (short-subunit alcohol dehydrogenase family)
MPFDPTPQLRGKRVLVTGASNETGPHVARAFARFGTALALTYHTDRSAGERVAQDCRDAGANGVHLFQLDLLDMDQCSRFVPQVADRLGGLDVLVAVAGAGAGYTPLTELGAHAFIRALQGQVAGNFAIARDAGLIMPEDGTGRIVLISATSCYKYTHAGYGFAKAALNELTKFLGCEFAERRITVNTLVPQLIDLDSISAELREKRKQFTPLGNIPHPDQIAEMCLVLCSPLFDIVTGQLIYMDGGYRLRPLEDR